MENIGKPVIEISSAAVVNVGTASCLFGVSGEYPEGHGKGSSLSGKFICTSNIVNRIDENTFETLNSIYKVISWE